MREFVLVAHDAPLTPEFSLDDLPGAAGRLDVICRSITAGLLRSHGIRRDTVVWVVVQDQLAIRFIGEDIRRLNPDERSTAALYRKAVDRAGDLVGHREIESSPGVYITRRGLSDVLDEIEDRGGSLNLLAEDGEPITTLEPRTHVAFVLSDHRDFAAPEHDTIARHTPNCVSLGPVALHADQAIVVTHNAIDTDGYQRYACGRP